MHLIRAVEEDHMKKATSMSDGISRLKHLYRRLGRPRANLTEAAAKTAWTEIQEKAGIAQEERSQHDDNNNEHKRAINIKATSTLHLSQSFWMARVSPHSLGVWRVYESCGCTGVLTQLSGQWRKAASGSRHLAARTCRLNAARSVSHRRAANKQSRMFG